MKLNSTLADKSLDYIIRVNRRANRLRLSVYSDGRIIVTTPKYISLKYIDSFVVSQRQWLMKKLNFFKSNPRQGLSKGSQADYEKYKSAAYFLVKKRLEYFSIIYGFKYNKFSIKNQATRWGSCSKKGSLNFNYQIFKLAPKLADYIIVHELCHLKEFNHSKRFWGLVAETIPNYLELRKELKHTGAK